MIIPYTRYKVQTELVRLPLVSVRLACNRKRIKVWALIDSGADFCVFNGDIASLLAIDLKKGKPLDIIGVVGGSTLAWIHQINLELEGYPSINIKAAFTETGIPDLSLVGQIGFFDNFQIRFHRYKDQIEIYPKSTTI